MSNPFTLDTVLFERVLQIRDLDFYLDLFFEQAEQTRQILLEQVNQNPAEGWAEAAHKLKGAAATLGFVSTAELLENILHVNLSDAAAKQDAIRQLDEECASINAYFADQKGA